MPISEFKYEQSFKTFAKMQCAFQVVQRQMVLFRGFAKPDFS